MSERRPVIQYVLSLVPDHATWARHRLLPQNHMWQKWMLGLAYLINNNKFTNQSFRYVVGVETAYLRCVYPSPCVVVHNCSQGCFYKIEKKINTSKNLDVGQFKKTYQ